MGDPQAPFAKILSVLKHNHLLGPDGRIAPDVFLVSMGDHFDWGRKEDREQATNDGLALLAWLASHPPAQVVLIAGNHDLARVGELLSFTDAEWILTRASADECAAGSKLEADFLADKPMLPSAGVASRDFSTFSVAQRYCVIRLLEARRFRLAFAPAPNFLITHAGVTTDNVKSIDAPSIANELNAAFDSAIDHWLTHRAEPFAIPGLHQPGSRDTGEARGILFHRPANPDVETDRWNWDGALHRRFDPRRLPLGLTQAIGHIRDGKCRTLMGPWCRDEPATDGPLRSLRTDGLTVEYARNTPFDSKKNEALMLFTDGGMLHSTPETYELLDLDTRQAFAR